MSEPTIKDLKRDLDDAHRAFMAMSRRISELEKQAPVRRSASINRPHLEAMADRVFLAVKKYIDQRIKGGARGSRGTVG